MGKTAATVRICLMAYRSRIDPARVRAWGTYTQMHLVMTTAMRQWATLPGGQEIETVFEQMFPATVRLVADETVDKTKS